MEYVVGFVTDGVGHALLLRKADNCKFEFMRGKLNGVGGAIEPNETPLQAMRREWAEETKLPDTPWRHFCTLHTEGGTVYMFHASSRQYIQSWIHLVQPRPEEPCINMPIADIAPTNAVVNVRWLIEMARTNSEPIECWETQRNNSSLKE